MRRLAFIGHQHRRAFEDIDELVLTAVPVFQCRLRPRRQTGQVDAEVAQPEDIAQGLLVAPFDAARERFRIDRTGPRLDGFGGDGDGFRFPVVAHARSL
jgi:hypothetical protein